jgi:hypothetical protein
MQELSDLPPEQRAAKYREFAADAEAWAERSSGQARQSYLLIAEQWRKLADELVNRVAKKTR